MSLDLVLADPVATGALGAALAASLPARAVVYLRGDLGAGKSCLARAMLQSLGVTGPIKSPTYTLIERYAVGVGEAMHIDLYRIANGAELEFLGLDAVADARLWLVEWPERGSGALPAPDLEVSLTVAGAGRAVRIEAASSTGARWLLDLSEKLNLQPTSEEVPRKIS